MEKVAVDGVSGCWLWQGFVANNSHGYATFWLNGKNRLAHRVAYEFFVGPIPEGLTIDHVKVRGCTSKSCVNPAHLEAVTTWENTLRGNALPALNFRKTHCDNGHPYDEENTYITKQGWRACRECHRIWKQSPKYRARKAQSDARRYALRKAEARQAA
jgi:hypothetical protein